MPTLVEINRQIALIAGWTDLSEWADITDPLNINIVLRGLSSVTNEYAIIPDYAENLNEIVKVFRVLEIPFDFAYSTNSDVHNENFIAWSCLQYRQEATSPSLALCNLLLAVCKPRGQSV